MKKSTYKNYIVKTICFTLMIGFTLVVNAQCPTISSQPPTICDAAGLTFGDLDTYAVDQGNGILWYDSATGGNSFNVNELVSEGVYYAGDNTGSCGMRSSITVNFEVTPSGQNLDAIYCENENPTFQDYINDVLVPNIPSGGGVELYSDFDLTMSISLTSSLPLGGSGYFVVFVDSMGCRSQIELGNTAVFSSPTDPTPPAVQEFCSDSNPTVANLNPGTSENLSWYDNIDGSGNPIPPALLLSTPLIDGNTYYVQINDIFCDSNVVAVIANIDEPFDAGESATLEYCNNNIPASDFNLFDELGGTPETTGTWSGPLTTSGGHLGTVNISSLATVGDYVFTYTITSNNACPDATSTVTIRISEILSSGIPSATNPATFCESDLPSNFDLFSLIDNEDPGGVWVQGTTNNDPVVSSPIDLTGFTFGTYNFTYIQNQLPNPCPEELTTVQIIILENLNAGIAINAIFCENDLTDNSPFDLFDALDGSQDNNNGVWTDSNGNTVSNLVNITGFTVTDSPYQYTYTIDNGICTDDETITITVEDAPESGTVNSTPEFCENEAPSSFNLFDLLDDEDQNGVWYLGTDTTGSTVTNPIDLSTLSDGTYNYTYDVNAIGSCDDELLTVTITINPIPETGIATPLTLCENDLASNSPLDLFDQLTGEDTGGTWTDDSASGALSGSILDLALLTIGSYNFTYSITDANGCDNSSTVTITVEDAPESGIANTPFEICLSNINTGQTVNLFDLLDNEDQSGIWIDDSSTGALVGSIVTIDNLPSGTYNFTYDVNSIGTCDDVLVTVSILINDTMAPTGVSPQEFCDTATVADLMATGNTILWYDSLTSTTPLENTTVLNDGQTYYATQTNAVTGCESSLRLAVDVVINVSPNTGNPASNPIVVCNDNNNIDLNTGLDGTQNPSGTWLDNEATGALTGNILDTTGLPAGAYSFTYFIAGLPPCNDASTTITVTIDEAANTGTDNILDICSDNGTVDLFLLLGGADTGGVWSPALNSGTGVFDPTVDTSGVYTYSITNACGAYSSEIAVTVTQAPNAGGNNSISVCTIDGSFDLTTQLTGNPDTNGVWTPSLASGTNIFDPLVDASGIYTYTVAAVAPCSTNAISQVTVTVSDSSSPIVNDANPTFCQANNPIVLDLNAVISATGTVNWYTDSTLTSILADTDALIDGEDYYATQTDTSGCESSNSVVVNVTIGDSPTPTLINPLNELCISDNPIIDDLTLNIIEFDSNINNVLWYTVAQGGSPLNGSDLLEPDTTYYAVLIDAVTGCESSIRLAFIPDLTACGELIIPDGFSPNNDGVNDTFDIDDINILVPNFELEIYNRYGNLVYRGGASTPRFNGKSNQTNGDGDLPVGVYFYIFRYNDGINKPVQGSLYLSR